MRAVADLWRLPAVVIAVAAVGAALLTAPRPALAATSQASTGSYGYRATARVTRVVDGDTFRAKGDFNRNGVKEERLIRLIGADSAEHDLCGYWAAKRFTTRLLTFSGGRGRVVNLSTDVPGATGKKDRLLYRVSVKRGGTRYGLTEELLQRGLAVWKPNTDQPTKYQRYHRIAETAAVNRRGLFAGDFCTAGPAASAQLELDVQWKSDPNLGEHARIFNHGPAKVDLSGWIIRAGRNRRLRIPAGRAIPTRKMLTVHTSDGTNNRYHRYLGTGRIWANIDVFNPFPNGQGGGNGGYLLDPGGDVRAWQMYACTRRCGHPAAGKVKVTDSLVNPPCNDRVWSCWQQEFVELRNTSATAVNVGRLVIDIAPWTVELPRELRLNPGDQIVVWSGDGTPNTQTDAVTTHNYYLNAEDGAPLRNLGDRILVRTYPGHIIHCTGWGDVSCSG